ncbi:hypothetical protein ILUMI_12996 [Ignelater luminosus]|uniref:CIDE-N domain-containing protein n=1 Tax=Ignelater luminosus TaxID=2038154 RepID=A0A8K0GB98_IGNLU|nr:hypothetical protein ILUMI_12996 [Ignelater luminosus]
MNVNGSQLVLEADGTYVDDDDILRALSAETLILLEQNEIWKSVDNRSTCSTVSTASIVYSSNTDQKSDSEDGILHTCDQDETGQKGNTKMSTWSLWNDFLIPWHKVSAIGNKTLINRSRDQKVKLFT